MAAQTRRSNLAREIALVLAIKFLALFVIWSVWFSHPESEQLSGERIRATVYSSHVVAQEGGHPDAKP
jgi:hypothetical protein